MSDTSYTDLRVLGRSIETEQQRAKERSDKFLFDLTVLAAPHGGVLLTWVDQSHDPGMIMSRLIGVSRVAQGGVCAAIASEWIRVNLAGHPEWFRNDFKMEIPPKYRGLQMLELRKAQEFKNTLENLGLEKGEMDRIFGAYQRLFARNPLSTALPKIFNQVKYLKDKLMEGFAKLREARAVYLLNSPITGTLVAYGKGNALLGELGHAVAVPGYYKLGLSRSGGDPVIDTANGGAHAMAFHFGTSHGNFRFLDANSGEWRFDTADKLLDFFRDYWERIYATTYGANHQFLLARF